MLAAAVLGACQNAISGTEQQVFVFHAPIGAQVRIQLQGAPETLTPDHSTLPARAEPSPGRLVQAVEPGADGETFDELFDVGSARLTAVGLRELSALAAALNHPDLAGQRFMIAGLSPDLVGPEHTEAIATRRADAVRRYLIVDGGVSLDRLESRSYALRDPADREPHETRLGKWIEIIPLDD